ncbi:MAG: cyclic nucleotide-binding domain-containing protein [Actinomycetota bacterium]
MDPKGLGGISLFAKLSKKERERVSRWADEIEVPAGTHLMDQGRLAHEFFVLVEGTVEIRKDGEHLANLQPDDFFGEIALVDHDRRTASVVATTPVRAIVMHAREFGAMRTEMPTVCAQIEDAIKERLAR